MARGGFVGRRTELELFASEFEEARSGRPRVVLLAGGAGIGKTALVHHFIDEHHAVASVLQADGDEAESGLAFGVLERLLAGLSVPLGERLSQVVAGTGAAPDPLVVGAEILGVLGTLQEQGPVIIFLDDAQWADPPSLAALTFVLRRLRADQVLVFVALRSGSQRLLPPGLLRLADGDRGRWVWLEGLEPSELQALSARAGVGELAPWMARRLYEHTEGNPLYALTLLRELGADILRAEDPLPPPPSLSVLVLSQLSGCSESAVRLVRAAAVLGRSSLLRVAADLAGEDQPLEAVDEVSAVGLLALESERGERVAFTHPLIQAIVYADLGAAQRAGLHARAATLLGGDEAVEHRVRASGPADATLSKELRERAGDEAVRGAWAAAARHFLAASRLEPSPEDRSDCLLEAAILMLGGMDIGGVLALQDTIIALPPSPRRSYVLGHLTFSTGRPAEAAGHFADALQAVDQEADPEVAAASAAWLAQCRVQASRGLEAAEMARVALRLAPVGSPIWEFAQGAERVGMGIAGQARPALAAAASEQASGSTTEGFVALTAIGILRLWTDELDGARRDLSAVEEFIARRGPIASAFPALFYLSEVELRAGSWDDALAHAHHLASLAADTDALYAAPYADAMLATIYALRGRWDAADEHIATLSAVPAGGDTAMIGYASLAAARLASARGDSATVLEAMVPLVDMGEADGVREPGVMPWRDLYAEALLRLGRIEETEEVLVKLEGLAKERELASGMAAAARVRGDVEASRGEWELARAAFQGGLEQANEVGMPFLRARLALDYGAFLRRTGQRRQAVAILEEAAELFGSLRSEPFLQRCERELEGSGRQRAPRGTSHLTLTPQELTVARLIARGLTNRAAASELVLSVKTIEYHLSNLYAKLGVGSRTQLIARLAETGQIDFQP